MKETGYVFGSLLLIILSVLFGIIVYPHLPNLVASHWNVNGEVNGHMSKFWGVFFIPLLSAGLLALFQIIPKIDPLKTNIKSFQNYYQGFILIMVAFLLYIHTITLLWNLGYTFNMNQVIAPAFGVLFYYIGVMVEHSKQNWFIGIRTPWTLSNEQVWNKTHHVGGLLFKVLGIIMIVGFVFSHFLFPIMFISIIATAIFLFGYSYYLYFHVNK